MSASKPEAIASTCALPSPDSADGLDYRDFHLPSWDHTPSSSATVSTKNTLDPSDILADGVFGHVPPAKVTLGSATQEISREVQESSPDLVPRKIQQAFMSADFNDYELPAFNTSNFPHRMCPPDPMQTDPSARGEWQSVVHPDGTMYFYNVFKGKNESLSIITEACLYGGDVLYEVTLFAWYMWYHITRVPEKFANARNLELVLNVKVDMTINTVVWSYYFIDHVSRMPFWMRCHKPNGRLHPAERLGTYSPEHLRYLLQAMYWEHCALYPRHCGGARIIPKRDHAKLVTELSWCAAESVIAPVRYTAPFTADEAVRLREQSEYLRKNSEEHPDQYIEISGRILSTIERWRYDSFHGTEVARHFRGQTILPPRRNSALYRMLVPALFYAPLSYLYDCRSVYLDGNLANEPEWTTYIKKLLTEWVDFVLYATIMLNANVAFLAVPNTVFFLGTVSTGSGSTVSPAAVLNCCSLLASIGSMAIGLLLIRQHRGEEIVDNPCTKRITFMQKRRFRRFEFEPLSILYSLPYALLLWSALLFLCALVVFTLLYSDRSTRATTGIVLIIVVSLSLWSIQMGRSSSNNHDFFRRWEDAMPVLPARRPSPARALVMASLGATKNLLRRTIAVIRSGVYCFATLKTERKCTGTEEVA